MRISLEKLLFGLLLPALVFISAGPIFTNAESNNTPPESRTESTVPIQDDLAKKQAERADLENQLADLEKQIEEHQKTIESYQKQGKNLKTEISSLNTKIEKLNLQIKSVSLTLTKLNKDINETQRNINRTENKIDIHRNAISKAVRDLYEADREGLMAIMLANNKLSDFFGNLNNTTLVQENLRIALSEIVKLRQDLLEEKEELSSQKEDAENLRAIQQAQKKNVETTQVQKTNLLQITKGKEAEYQKLLKRTQESAAQIRSRIFELLGGGELTFEKAYDYARLAEGATGVRAALILAVLNRESLLGKNVGRCAYNQRTSTGRTAMNPRDIPTFLDLLGRLGIDPNSVVAKVSCPNSDGYYGGAMGPAQFVPSTWRLYEADISKVTGSNPANPWNNSDAFVATGLYLKKFGADGKNTTAEKKAAAIYYCGGSSWQRYSCSIYAKRVVETAEKFQRDIEILNSSS